jgi:hypothetical protein
VDQDRLEAPVTLPEAKMVVQSMNKNSAPGPDGFGLAFYCAVWDQIAPQIGRLLPAFREGRTDLSRINTSCFWQRNQESSHPMPAG